MIKNVWVINRKEYDLSKAEEFGRIKLLTEGTVSPFDLNRYVQWFRESMKESKAHDYILPCGSTPLNMVAAALMMFKHSKVNILVFNPKTQAYTERGFTEQELAGIA